MGTKSENNICESPAYRMATVRVFPKIAMLQIIEGRLAQIWDEKNDMASNGDLADGIVELLEQLGAAAFTDDVKL